LLKELRWKIFFELAQTEERCGNVAAAREAYVKSVRNCPPHLTWRIWLSGAVSELKLASSSPALVERLFQRALETVPKKKLAQVYIEYAHAKEYVGELEAAREILARARHDARSDWKVFLETILLEMRAQEFDIALEHTEKALEVGDLFALFSCRPRLFLLRFNLFSFV
jgi:la-related protein 1